MNIEHMAHRLTHFARVAELAQGTMLGTLK